MNLDLSPSSLGLPVLAFGIALLAGAVLTPVVRAVAIQTGQVRGQQEDRWHTRPTPAIGGIAIWLGFLLGIAALWVAAPEALQSGLDFRPPQAVIDLPASQAILLAASVAFGVGLLDDLYPLSPLAKLAGQLVASSVLLLAGIGVWLTGIYGVDVLISLLWFVGVTNALNLLDNMDGVAGGVAAIAGAYLSILFVVEGQMGFLLVALAFVGSVVGFLAHNYPPARIFMGDSGSLFLGIFLSGLALAPAEGLSRSLVAAVAAPALLLAIPILDTTVVTISRLLEGRSIAQGGTDHTTHRLVALGVSEERAMWLLWAIAAVGGAVGILLRTTARETAVLMGGGMTVFLVALGAYLLSVRFRRLTAAQREDVPLYRIAVAVHERFPLGVMVLDAMLVALVYYGSYVIRWDQGALAGELRYFSDSVVLVVSVKLLILTITGTYAVRWQRFSLSDAVRVARSSVLASVAVISALFLADSVGLSRGVMVVDGVLCTVALIGLRISFRWFEGTTRTLSRGGTPAVVLGSADDMELVLRVLELRDLSNGENQLRPVALADVDFPRLRARARGMPLFGTPNALNNALQETRASALLVASNDPSDPLPDAVTTYLKEQGGVDLYRVAISVGRFDAARPPV